MKPLRPYQGAAVDAAIKHAAAGRKRVCIAAPCGAGKTRIGVEFCQRARVKGSRVLWCTHRKELIRQSHDALKHEGVEADIIAAGVSRNYERIAVASIQTLDARDQRPEADVLVLDECHHFVSAEWLKIIRSYPNAYVIGLTATPSRSDGIGLGMIFDAIVPVCQPKDLIATGHLVPAIVLGPTQAVGSMADYPVDWYRAKAPGEKAVAFCSTIKEGRALAQAFTAGGFPAACIDSNMDDGQRELAIRQYRSGQLRVLTSVNVFIEGWDAPETSVVLLCRRIGSELVYLQSTGRGMRPSPGKTRCLVGDFYGSTWNLQILPGSDRVYDLSGRGIAARNGELIVIVQCPQCGMAGTFGVFSGGVCKSCGWRKPEKPDPRVVRQETIEIQEERLKRFPSAQAKVEWLQNELAKQRGRTGGILIRFSRTHHGTFPNHAMREASGFNECLRRERAERESRTA